MICYWCDQPAVRFCVTSTDSIKEKHAVVGAWEPEFYNPGLAYAWCETHDHTFMQTITYDEYVVLKVLTS